MLANSAMGRQGSYLGRFLKRANDWLRRRSGKPAAYVWLIENPPDGGLNAHILIHVPFKLRVEFRALMKGWLAGQNESVSPKTIHARVFFGIPTLTHRKRITCATASLAFCDMSLKGMEPSLGGGYLGVMPIDQGVVMGKRTGYSQALRAGLRWKVIRFPQYPGVWIGGPESRVRHWVGTLVPELLAKPGQSAAEWAERPFPDFGASD